MTVTTILQCPNDIIGLIASRAGADVVALRKTCRQLRDGSKKAFEVYQRQLLVERYGTHLESELSTPFYILDGRGKAVLNLTDPDLWLELDQGSIPKMINYHTHFFEGKSSTALWKAKYQFYRREPYRDLDDRLRNLFEEHVQIVEELAKQPLNPAHPLQDLRDRNRRYGILSKQRAILLDALSKSQSCYNSFITSLSRLERVLFYIASLFHSIFKKSYTDTVAFPEFSLSLEKLITVPEGIKLGEATISLGDELPRVEIRANFYLRGSPRSKTAFSIVRTSDKKELGYFEIERVWTRIRENGSEDLFYTEDVVNVGENIRVLKDRRLHIDHLSNETDNGNEEITNLLTRLALEIFQHESEQQLVIAVGNIIYSKTDNAWQEQIKNNPLLSPTLQGPILPKFFCTNLFRFEKG